MGLFNFFGGKTKEDHDEEKGDNPIYPYHHDPIFPAEARRQQNSYYYSLRNGDYSSSTTTTSFARLRKIISLPKSLYNASKNVCRKLCTIFHLTRKPGANDHHEPILPVKNPAPRFISKHDPLLVQTRLISSPSVALNEDKNEECQNNDSIIVELQADPGEVYSDNMIMLMDRVSNSLSISKVENKQEQKKKKRRRGKRKEESSVMSTMVAVDEGIRWIKHYSNRHRILIVGDGDFSFSACLAVAFGSSASNMIATSLDSKAFLKENYQKFVSNMKELKSRGCQVMHGIDATKIASHELLGHRKFDRIIYNFPFAGFFKGLSTESQIGHHRELVNGFLKNAKEMICKNGEIHVSHKTNGRFHQGWKLEDLASSHKLRLIEAVKFKCRDYPGYNTKYGFGGDNNFNCNPSKTYKFGLG